MEVNDGQVHLSRICRTCLAEKDINELNCLFENDLDAALSELTQISVTKEDGLPDSICQNCVLTLKISFGFKQQCHRSEAQLRKTLECGEDNYSDNSAFVAVELEESSEQTLKGNVIQESEIELESFKEESDDGGNRSSSPDCPKSQPEDPNHTEKQWKCEECGKSYHFKDSLKAHQIRHGMFLKCEVCEKEFDMLKTFESHIRTHDGYRPFSCTICKKSYPRSTSVYSHMRSHKGEKKHLCVTCGKSFFQRGHLTTHLRTHTGEKKFQCTICGKRTVRAVDLQIHMRSHTGERPYSCDLCSKSYHTSSNLAQHKRTHLGIRDHICNICSKAFGDKKTLKTHFRIHTGEKPYVCGVCGKRYTQSSQLWVHKKTHINPESNS